MVAITPESQSSAPEIILATLRSVLAKGEAAHLELASRMERAALIVALRAISPAMAPENQGTAYWVEASDGSREYWVTLAPRGYQGDRCNCPDYLGRGGPCKHAIAVRLLQTCERAAARRAGLTPLPMRAYSDDDRFELTAKGLAAATTTEPEPAA